MRRRDVFSLAAGALASASFAAVGAGEMVKEKAPCLRVVLTFDDGYASAYRVAFPLLREYRIPAMVFISTALVEKDGQRLSWAALRELARAGWEIGNHTHSHRSLKGLPPRAIEEELSRAQALIAERLGVTPASFAYPMGEWDANVLLAVAARFARARAAWGIDRDTPRWGMWWPQSPLAIPSFPVRRTTAVEEIAQLAAHACRTGDLLVLQFHDIADEGGPWAYPPARFRAVVRLLVEQGARFSVLKDERR